MSKINELLEVNGIEKIENSEELKKYFDLNDLDADKTPKIVCDQKVVIVVDNTDFNETYLIDIINEIIEEYPRLGKNESSVKFLYLDNFDVKRELFAPSIEKTDDLTISEFEKINLPPALLIINPMVEQFSSFTEPQLQTFNKDLVVEIFEMTKILE